MRLLKYFLISLFLISINISFLISCEEIEKDTEDSVFVLSTKVLNLSSEGETKTITYSIQGPKAGNEAVVTSDSEWLKIGKIYSSEFSITAQKNETSEDRTATVSLSYPGTKTAKIHVIQSKEDAEKPVYKKFRVELSDITTSSANVKVTPINAAETYHYSVVSKSDYNKTGKDAYIQAVISRIREMNAIYGDQYAPLSSFLNTNILQTSASSLYDNTEHYVVIFDLNFDATGKAVYSGDVELFSFKTLQATQLDMTFTISLQGTYLGVIPSANYDYISDLTTLEAWEEFDSPEDVARLYIRTMNNPLYGGISQFIYKGSKTINYDYVLTEKGKTYVAYAVGYNSDTVNGGLTTKVEYKLIEYK